MQRKHTDQSIWWGNFQFEDDQAGRWKIGPSTLWIYRSARSWHLIHHESTEANDDAASVDPPLPIGETSLLLDDLPTEATVARYSFQETDRQISVIPALADRAVIVRPDVPLYILAGEEVTIYVSTPIWIRVEVGPEGRLLREFPSHRLSDTWFGPSTRDGELCYSVKTVGRLRLENLPFRLHRAVTPMQVLNRASDALHIDRVQLPVQYLSLHEGEGHFLWTESVTLEREIDGDLTSVRFDKGPPREAGKTHLLRGPRVDVRSNIIMRTFNSLFNRLELED